MKSLLLIFSIVAFTASPLIVQAQDSNDEIEKLFAESQKRRSKDAYETVPNKADQGDVELPEVVEESAQSGNQNSGGGTPTPKSLSDLNKETKFEDIAVISRRYLPRTKRLELFAAGSGVLNDPFFQNIGGQLSLAYSFTERWALEFNSLFLSTEERSVTADLREKRQVTTTSIVTPKAYYGGSVRWSPVYGKMGLFGKSIKYFDMHFNAGAGVTQTNQSKSETTYHLATGQSFAVNKSFAVRWDFAWHVFQAQESFSGTTSKSIYNNLILSVGVSVLIPGAGYR